MLTEQEALLEQVKVFGRDPSTAGPIFTEKVRGVSGDSSSTEADKLARVYQYCRSTA